MAADPDSDSASIVDPPAPVSDGPDARIGANRLTILESLENYTQCGASVRERIGELYHVKAMVCSVPVDPMIETVGYDEVRMTWPLVITVRKLRLHQPLYPAWTLRGTRWEPANQTAKDLMSGEIIQTMRDGVLPSSKYIDSP